MSLPFDQQAEDPSAWVAGGPADRAAKWLVGDQLACVLHLGDGELAYRLSAQGHEVTVAGSDVHAVRDPDVVYVRSLADRLPFAARSFDAVVVPHLRETPSVLAEHARVLGPRGLICSISRSYDESIPWVRKLHEIVGHVEQDRSAAVDTFGASGLFHDAETTEFALWEKLDLAGLLQLARATAGRELDRPTLGRVHELFSGHTAQTGHLRLRHVTRCVRARVDSSALSVETPPPDTMLLDFR